MPECQVEVRWPDGSDQSIYSPSLIMTELFSPGDRYPVAEFVTRVQGGLAEASRRVEAKFGFPCSLAAASRAAVESAAARQPTGPDCVVEVTALRR